MEALVDWFKKLKVILETYLNSPQIERIEQAYILANHAHEGQFRSSGEPYITHPVEVACIIARLKLDPESVMGALLHDVIEDTPYSCEQLSEKFGESVAQMVEGVSKLDKLKFRDRKEASVENFKKMLLAMTQDIRVVLIKLADRTHNMQTLGSLRSDKQARIAKETLDIYAPIAHKLGIEQIRRELEDLSLKAIYPKRYELIQKLIEKGRRSRANLIQQIIDDIKKVLAESNINCSIKVVQKNIYTIYRKKKEKQKRFNSVMDVCNFQVRLDSIDDCYRALGKIHSIYSPRPGKIKDYIAVPKINGYQAIHTSLVGPKGNAIEVHLATEGMERIANLGVVANMSGGDYSQNDDSCDIRFSAIGWISSLLELQQNSTSSKDFVNNVKRDLFPQEIYVFTPKGRIERLPKGAVVLDFAYSLHDNIGDQCATAFVNYKKVPVTQKLKSGQMIEIILDPDTRPDPSWLKYVVTGKARSSIKSNLKKIQRKEDTLLGLYQLQLKLRPHTIEEITAEQKINVVKNLELESFDEVLLNIGLGKFNPTVIAYQLLGQKITIDTDGDLSNNGDILDCDHNQMLSYASCCSPIPADDIVALAIKDHGIVVHNKKCRNIANIEHKKIIEVSWEQSNVYNVDFSTKIRVEAKKHDDLEQDIEHIIKAHNSKIISLNHSNSIDQESEKALTIIFTVKNDSHLNKILTDIKQLKNVISAKRLVKLVN